MAYSSDAARRQHLFEDIERAPICGNDARPDVAPITAVHPVMKGSSSG
jgi:hypothetical protein